MTEVVFGVALGALWWSQTHEDIEASWDSLVAWWEARRGA